jgi:hypothetical protein
MRYILLFFFIFNCCHSFGQTRFQKTFGGASNDLARCVRQTFDGGYIIAGNTLSYGSGLGDCFVIKTNANGDTLWTVITGTAYDERLNSIQQTADSGFILGATTNTSVTANDYYIVRLSANGTILWTKTYGGSEDDVEPFVLQTSGGGFVIVGTSDSYSLNPLLSDVPFIQLDASGNIVSQSMLDIRVTDKIADFQKTAGGGYVLLGDSMDLTGLASSGSVLWTRNIGAVSTIQGRSIRQTSDGGFIIAGNIDHASAGTGWDILAIKTNATGDIVWTKSYGGAGYDAGTSVEQTTDGGYIIAGLTSGFGAGSFDGYLVKTNAAGDILWTKVYGGTGNDQAQSIGQTTDGGYVIAGNTSSFGAGSGDSYLLKTDANGATGCSEGATSTSAISFSLTDSVETATVYAFTFAVTNPAAAVFHGCGKFTICSFTGIYSDIANNKDAISIYPNPFVSEITIRADINTVITLYDYTGKEIFRATSISAETVLNTEGLAAGLYSLKADGLRDSTTSGRGVANYKVVKTN